MKPKLEEAISVVATGHTQTTIKYQKVTARRDCLSPKTLVGKVSTRSPCGIGTLGFLGVTVKKKREISLRQEAI